MRDTQNEMNWAAEKVRALLANAVRGLEAELALELIWVKEAKARLGVA